MVVVEEILNLYPIRSFKAAKMGLLLISANITQYLTFNFRQMCEDLSLQLQSKLILESDNSKRIDQLSRLGPEDKCILVINGSDLINSINMFLSCFASTNEGLSAISSTSTILDIITSTYIANDSIDCDLFAFDVPGQLHIPSVITNRNKYISTRANSANYRISSIRDINYNIISQAGPYYLPSRKI